MRWPRCDVSNHTLNAGDSAKGNENDDESESISKDGLPRPLLGWEHGWHCSGSRMDRERTEAGICQARSREDDRLQS